MDYGIVSCIPILVLIVGALITKKIAEMMILSSVLGAILVYKGGFFSGYIEMLYGVLSNSSYQFILIILLGFGGMIRLLQKSGALAGFGGALARYATGPKKPLLIAWLMSVLMFVDDYLNTLAVSFSMRDITDKNRIPREHLAYQVTCMAASLCVLVPFTSWTAFTIGLISDYGLGFAEYVRAIPMMLFPILTVVACLLVALGALPKLGPLRAAHARVAAGGPALVEEKAGASVVKLEADGTAKASSPLNFIVPVVVLVAVVMLFDNDLVHGLLAAIVVQAALYLPQKLMTLTEFMDTLFDGVRSMASLALIICFAYILNAANSAMGLSEFLVGGIGAAVPPAALPALVFVLVAFATFATSGYWVIQVITIPIFIPLAATMGVNPSLIIAALMSGVVFGSIFCFYSDVVFMTAAGTGVSNLRQIKVSAPYVLGAAGLSALGYLLLGLLGA